MEDDCKNIAYGMAGKWFYCISEIKDREGGFYYCLYQIEEYPTSMHPDDIQKFMEVRMHEGCSLSDDWDGVLEALGQLFALQSKGAKDKRHRRRLAAEELAEYNFQHLCEFLNTDLAVFVYDNGEYTLESFDYIKGEYDRILKRASNPKEISDTFTDMFVGRQITKG